MLTATHCALEDIPTPTPTPTPDPTPTPTPDTEPTPNPDLEQANGKYKLSTFGVWHRPNCMGNETSLQGICEVLDTFQSVGINLVFLETFYHGMAMYRSNYVPYYKGFDNYNYGGYNDYLTAFVAEAQKRGIQVHAWVEDFYIGINENYFTKYLPDWLLVTSKGEIRQSEGDGYLFLDPANAEVRSYLVKIYKEMFAAVPDLCGINLDYIRYPVSSSSDDTGFTETAMRQFAQQEGLNLDATNRNSFIAALNRNGLYSRWVDFRAKCVTTFVAEVSEMVRNNFPHAVISTAVFPDSASTYNTKKQDFTTWVKNGYIDVVTPMAYYDDVPTLKYYLKNMIAECSDCYCYAGLSAIYHNLPVNSVKAQMSESLRVGADGVVFFGSQNLLGNSEYLNALKVTDKTVKPIVAHDKALYVTNAVCQSISEKLNKNGTDIAQVKEFCDFLKGFEKMPPDTVQSLQNLISQVEKATSLAEKMSAGNAADAKQELAQLIKLLQLRLRFLQSRQ